MDNYTAINIPLFLLRNKIMNIICLKKGMNYNTKNNKTVLQSTNISNKMKI
jgi:hypothetical protein